MPPRVSIIVPTYREAQNLPHLLAAIDAVRRQHGIDLELLIMDDDSGDGTEALVEALGYEWVRLHVRKNNRGLSPAVIDGLKLARGDALVVMDADLSHPPDCIPAMLAQLDDGADFVIGSRYAAGGTTDADWGAWRRLNSRVATWLARPFTDACDPMSGFLAFPRRTLERAAMLNPVGYKIGLELIVRCACRDVREVPIHFADRTRGQSKLGLREQLKYLRHLGRLSRVKYPRLAPLALAALTGAAAVLLVALLRAAMK